MSDPDICEVGGGGLILPFSKTEQTWPRPARAFMYVTILAWFFLGVSIIADIFMAGIEAITSKRKQYRLANGQIVCVKVWNATVANLTLMALGSSAPEILLNVIEILSENFYAGELGPSTIVGSAAFNLLVIIAVCVYVIPAGETRTLRQPGVFKVTAFFSIFAYLWLVFILFIVSKDLVQAWEGVLTFCFFPLLVVIAFLVDIGVCDRRKQEADSEEKRILKDQMLERGMEISEKDAEMMLRAKHEAEAGKSKAAVRAENGLTASKGISPSDLSVGFVASRFCFHEATSRLELEVEKTGDLALDARVGIEFRTSDGSMMSLRGHYTPVVDYLEIPPGQKVALVAIERDPNTIIKVSPEDATKDSAKIGRFDDEKNPLAAALELDEENPQEENRSTEAFFNVEISQAFKLSAQVSQKSSDGAYKWPARNSGLDYAGSLKRAQAPVFLSLADEMNSKELSARVNILPDYRKVQVAITSSEESGNLRFENPEITFAGPSDEEEMRISVQRFNGSVGELSCRFTTEADTARPVYDYEHTEGDLFFPPGVMSQEIVVKILPKAQWEASDRFFVILSDIQGRTPCVMEDFAVCGITISSDHAAGLTNNILRLMDTNMNLERWQEGNREWKEQWIAAFRPNSGDEDQLHEATAGEWTLHIIALPWKVLFALVPPPAYCNGWLCFFVALGFIGVVTAFIADLAGLLGCVIGLQPAITAITIVAVGTSLPDTFASKVAAIDAPFADNAIGNVTGSNSVNVFLGLGLPWMIASIYWEVKGPNSEWARKYPEQALKYPDGGFVVVAGDLVYSVIVFCIAASTCICSIWYRRLKFQAELGGPVGYKINTSVFFILLWFFYVGVSSWKTVAGDVSTAACVVGIIMGGLAVVVGMVVIIGVIHLYNGFRNGKQSDADRIIDAIHNRHFDKSMSALGAAAASSSGSLPEAISRLQEHIAGLNAVCRALESMNGSAVSDQSKRKSAKLRSSCKAMKPTESSAPLKKAVGKKRSEKMKKKADDMSGMEEAVAE